MTVLLCNFLFRDVDLSEMMAIIRTECKFGFIAVMLVISILSHILRAMRWGIQLRALGINATLFTLVLSIFGTYAVNLVLPRLGELWRTGYVAKRQDAPFATVFGSMVADRMADVLMVLLLTVVTFIMAAPVLTEYFANNSATLNSVGAVLASPYFWIGLAVFFGLLWWFIKQRSANPLVVKLKEFAKGLWQGFAVVGAMPGRFRWLVLTLLIWGCYFVQLYVAFFAFDFTADIVSQFGIIAVMVTFVLSSLSMGVPSNGGIGPWQWSVVVALTMYGLGESRGIVFANMVMGCNTVLVILLGVFTFASIVLGRRRNKLS